MPTEPKQFNLKPIETQLLSATQAQFQTLVSNVLSFIAIERLAYTVTENTQFAVSQDFTTVSISEREPEAAPEVVTGTSAKDAINGEKG